MNPIQSLQHMLNHLARTVSTLPRIAETGYFDEDTLEAVMIFQRDSRLPVTGVVDLLTWNAITSAYYLNLFQTGTPPSLSVFPTGTTIISEADYDPLIFVVQAMMSALYGEISNFEKIELNGVNNNKTTKKHQDPSISVFAPGKRRIGSFYMDYTITSVQSTCHPPSHIRSDFPLVTAQKNQL